MDALMAGMAKEIDALLDAVQTQGARRYRRTVDVGYVGQSYQVLVPVDDGLPDAKVLAERFAALYREKYGYFYDDVPAEIVNVRVLGEIEGAGLQLATFPAGGGAAAPVATRDAYSASEGAMIPFAVYDRAALAPGMTFAGPAVVEEATATTVVDKGGQVRVDEYGSLVIDIPTD